MYIQPKTNHFLSRPLPSTSSHHHNPVMYLNFFFILYFTSNPEPFTSFLQAFKYQVTHLQLFSSQERFAHWKHRKECCLMTGESILSNRNILKDLYNGLRKFPFPCMSFTGCMSTIRERLLELGCNVETAKRKIIKTRTFFWINPWSGCSRKSKFHLLRARCCN